MRSWSPAFREHVAREESIERQRILELKAQVYDAELRAYDRRREDRSFVAAVIMAVALLVALGFALTAHAADCAPRDGIIAKLDTDWGETLRAAGETEGGMIEVYANSSTRTWTILLTRPDMSACLLATGDGWVAPERPMPRPKGETL